MDSNKCVSKCGASVSVLLIECITCSKSFQKIINTTWVELKSSENSISEVLFCIRPLQKVDNHLGTWHPRPNFTHLHQNEYGKEFRFVGTISFRSVETRTKHPKWVFSCETLFSGQTSGREVKKGCVSLLISLNNTVQVIKRLNLFDNPNRKHFFNPNSLKRVTPWRKSFNSCAFFRTNANSETERVCQVPTSFLGKVVEYDYQKLSLNH